MSVHSMGLDDRPEENFFNSYLEITGGTEVPTFFRRWAIITGLGAFVGRSVYYKFGSTNIYPNMYVIFIAEPGSKKSSAIVTVKRLLAKAGYANLAAEKTTKAQFIMDLAGALPRGSTTDSQNNLYSFDLNNTPAECFIVADEFTDFFGDNILDFVAFLGVLWDYEGTYRGKTKHGGVAEISNPTISILSGSTPSTFADTFPIESIGQGFFSRLIPVYSEGVRKRITFPPKPSEEDINYIIDSMQDIQLKCTGEMTMTKRAEKLLDNIYVDWTPIQDARFAHYGTRRLIHLIKLAMIHTLSRKSMQIDTKDIIQANTILSHTEHSMPRALGEFGKSKNASVAHKLLGLLERSDNVVDFSSLWAYVSNDLLSLGDLGEILRGLVAANKIQAIDGGFLAKKKKIEIVHNDYINYSYLTKGEIYGE